MTDGTQQARAQATGPYLPIVLFIVLALGLWIGTMVAVEVLP